jgi:Zn-dependent protease
VGDVRALGSRSAVRPSPIFLVIVAATAAAGIMAWRYESMFSDRGAQLAVFGFVLAAWVLSLCLHEFAHAYLAYRSGDHSVATRGYLTLDPRKYADVILSFALPVAFLLVGGIGLPGGAVWIERHRISGRWRHSLISAAGPLTNVVLAVALAATAGAMYEFSHTVFWSALSFLAFLQVTAALLNLLPVPGLDGFGILEPFLPRRLADKANEIGGYVFLGVLALLWLPPINRVFFDAVRDFTALFGVEAAWISDGFDWFRFWG